MARTAWAVAPGVPHHITQRGNRRQETFFKEHIAAGFLMELDDLDDTPDGCSGL